jgi:imidazolonepropionase-like amidohydrolase
MAVTTVVAYAADWVFDGHRLRPDHAVVVAGDAVTAVCPRAEVPPGVSVVSHPGSTLVPGLIDVHAHYMRWAGPLFLAYGVTTVRDVGNDLAFILDQRAAAPNAATPRLLCVGPLLDGRRPSHPFVSRACATREAAVTAVRETAAAGVDGIKFYHKLAAAWLPDLVAEARRHGLLTGMHCLQTGVLAAAEAGVDEFYHLDGLLADVWPDHPPGWLSIWGLPGFRATCDAQQRVADRLAALGITATPTLVYWESQWRLRDPEGDPALPDVPPDLARTQGNPGRDPEAAAQWRAALQAAQGFLRLLLERGVRVLPGSDVPCGCVTPGLSLWHELGLLAEAGLPPLAALQAATATAADFLGLPDRGRLQPGARADLAVLRGDLTAGLPREPDMLVVVCDGHEHSPRDLRARYRELLETAVEDPWGKRLIADDGG